ncbi:MAG: T9SS type A sorting domain-containing protein [Ignavibacteriae bacterium]|nr:T9SS type A sorting domain-containing protein [Ignavibacteriota bacterium]
MKKNLFISILFFLSFIFSAHSQQVYDYNNNWGINGFSINNQNSSGVELNFSVNKLFIEDVNVDGINMKAAKISGIFLPNEAGMPDLAGTGRYLAVPEGATVTYRIVSYKTEVIKDIDIAPAPELPLDNDPNPLKYTKNQSVYSRNAYYPESPVRISETGKIRGLDVVILGITPFQYNPVTRELIVYTDLKVQVDFIGGNGKFGDDSYRNRWWEPILADNILNYSSLPVINFDTRYKDIMTENGYEYVIIVPNNPEFSAWADTIKNFRNAQGIKTGVYKLSEIGGNTVSIIKNWVTNAYNTWTIKPAAICLLADYGTDASGASTIISQLQTHPGGYPAFASDNYYADINGDDMPEIVFSRIIANDNTQLQTLITKELNYERNPPTDPNYYNHPITALGWQTERWFQLCSELVGGYFKKIKNKNPVRINKIYSGTPGTVWSTATNTATVVNYFGTVGLGYIPMTPDSVGGFDGGTATMVVNAINAKAFILQHRDHGMYTGWGEPGFTTSYIPQLTNTEMPFVFSINCETGAYHNPSGCPANGSFVEVFYRYKYNNQNSGTLGMVCPSETSYSFVNDAYTWGMYDNMWPDFMPAYGSTPTPRGEKPAFGMSAGKYFLQQSSWPYNTSNKQVTYRLFHMHGDAFFTLYSEVPQPLAVTHNSTIPANATSFNVVAPSGSFIALSINGNILGTATATGSRQSIPISGTLTTGQIMKVVVTKQNYYRYESNVNVGLTGIVSNTEIPKSYSLSQNYPNPFNPVTKISYALPKDGFTTIKIYDVLSREIATLVSENKTAGYYSVDFDASAFSSGVYFYKLESGAFSEIKRMMLIK